MCGFIFANCFYIFAKVLNMWIVVGCLTFGFPSIKCNFQLLVAGGAYHISYIECGNMLSPHVSSDL